MLLRIIRTLRSVLYSIKNMSSSIRSRLRLCLRLLFKTPRKSNNITSEAKPKPKPFIYYCLMFSFCNKHRESHITSTHIAHIFIQHMKICFMLCVLHSRGESASHKCDTKQWTFSHSMCDASSKDKKNNSFFLVVQTHDEPVADSADENVRPTKGPEHSVW